MNFLRFLGIQSSINGLCLVAWNRSEIQNGSERIKGPLIWSKLLKGNAGILGPAIRAEFKKGMQGSTDGRIGPNFSQYFEGQKVILGHFCKTEKARYRISAIFLGGPRTKRGRLFWDEWQGGLLEMALCILETYIENIVVWKHDFSFET